MTLHIFIDVHTHRFQDLKVCIVCECMNMCVCVLASNVMVIGLSIGHFANDHYLHLNSSGF